MREKTYHLYLNEEERSQVIQSLIALKNNGYCYYPFYSEQIFCSQP